MKNLILISLTFLSLIACDKDKVKDIGLCTETFYNEDTYQDKVGFMSETDNFAQTGDFAEIYRCLHAPDKINMETREYFISVYSIKVEKLNQGDVLEFFTSGEVTNETPKPMGMWWEVVLAEHPLDVDGIILNKAKGYNISPNMHHGVFNESGAFKADQDYSNVYINVVLHAASGEKLLKNEFIVVEPDYGSLTLVRHFND